MIVLWDRDVDHRVIAEWIALSSRRAMSRCVCCAISGKRRILRGVGDAGRWRTAPRAVMEASVQRVP